MPVLLKIEITLVWWRQDYDGLAGRGPTAAIMITSRPIDQSRHLAGQSRFRKSTRGTPGTRFYRYPSRMSLFLLVPIVKSTRIKVFLIFAV